VPERSVQQAACISSAAGGYSLLLEGRSRVPRHHGGRCIVCHPSQQAPLPLARRGLTAAGGRVAHPARVARRPAATRRLAVDGSAGECGGPEYERRWALGNARDPARESEPDERAEESQERQPSFHGMTMMGARQDRQFRLVCHRARRGTRAAWVARTPPPRSTTRTLRRYTMASRRAACTVSSWDPPQAGHRAPRSARTSVSTTRCAWPWPIAIAATRRVSCRADRPATRRTPE
jgi:hypothetical protein